LCRELPTLFFPQHGIANTPICLKRVAITAAKGDGAVGGNTKKGIFQREDNVGWIEED